MESATSPLSMLHHLNDYLGGPGHGSIMGWHNWSNSGCHSRGNCIITTRTLIGLIGSMTMIQTVPVVSLTLMMNQVSMTVAATPTPQTPTCPVWCNRLTRE